MIPTFFLVTILVFLSVRFIPGDVVDMLLYRMEVGAGGGDAMDREKLERRLGLDVPAYVQYTRWMGGILLRGDLGKPLLKAEPVGQLIARPAADHHRAWSGVDPHRSADRSAHRDLLCNQTEHPGRLRRSLFRHLRPGHAQLLAGHDHPHLPGDLVGLVSAAAPGAPERRLRRPLWHLHRAGSDPGHLSGSGHDAHDPHDDAGGAPAGLHPHRLGQGPQRARGHPAARHQERADPGGDLDWPAAALSVGGSVIMEQMFAIPGLGRLLINALNDRDYPLISGINLFFASRS